MEFFKCDVSNKEDVLEVKQKLYDLNVSPSILVNNAGIWNRGKRICELKEDELQRVIDVNLMGPFRLIRQFLPGMLQARHGRIVNVSSILGIGGVAQMST